MSSKIKNRDYENYYSGGLAELVSSPSHLTYSFISTWFTGSQSLGMAMKILGLPYQKVYLPMLALAGHELVVDLKAEEETLYDRTIFTYKKQDNTYDTPKLVVNFSKTLNPVCLINTVKIMLLQSQWIAKPEKNVAIAKKLIEEMPEELDLKTIQEIDELLKNSIFPRVIAIGLMSEFYNQLILKMANKKHAGVNSYISSRIAEDDWFFRSISDQIKVKQGVLSFEDYINSYGIRADKDYELTSPRWYEIQDLIKKRIESIDARVNKKNPEDFRVDGTLKKLADTSVELQILRNEAKRKALIYIDKLRNAIINIASNSLNIGSMTREDLLNGKVSQNTPLEKMQKQTKDISDLSITSGKGVCVSQGHVEGKVKNITNNDMDIQKDTIGIFPNASPEFANQYSKCIGMIFLKGGQTSHGSIVAREFEIPAIIDNKAQGISDNLKIDLNATTGEWNIV